MKTLLVVPFARNSIALAALLFTAATPMRAADAVYYFVAKSFEFRQNSAASPVPKGNPARFSAQVGLSVTNAATNATIQALPGGAVSNLTLGVGARAGVLDIFSFHAKYASQAALDSAYPNGSYQMVIGAVHDGIKTLTLTLNGNSYPGSAPYLSNPFDTNFSSIVVTNPAAAFTLTWAPFAGGTSSDFIQVTLGDSLGNPLLQTPAPGQPGALNGAATSLEIPANTLPSGAQVFATLVFAKIVALNSAGYPGVPGYAAYYVETDFGLVTLAEDTLAYNLTKQQLFNQTSSGAPVLAGANPFRFIANVLTTASNSVTSAQVQAPAPGGLNPLSPDPTDTLFSFVQRFGTQAALDTTFVSGMYTLQVNTVHDGSHALPLTLPTTSFPGTPHITDWAATQSVNANADFNLTWDLFSGAAALDYIRISAVDSLGNPLVLLDLPSTATNFVFTAGTFQSAQTYSVQVQFRHIPSQDTTTYPGATGSVRFFSITSINLISAVGTAAPSLAVVTTNGLRPFELQLTGQSGGIYAIDASTNLQSGLWVPLITNTAVNGQFIFTDLQSSNFSARFYRGRVVN
jgi:hypothetical protein